MITEKWEMQQQDICMGIPNNIKWGMANFTIATFKPQIKLMRIPSFLLSIISVALFFSCQSPAVDQHHSPKPLSKAPLEAIQKTALVVLGNVQDAGFPQIGCMKACCRAHWYDQEIKKRVTCLGIIEQQTGKTWMFEATPDIKEQTKMLSDYAGHPSFKLPDGIFLTHGHMGHYTGLMHLGREAINAEEVPVFAMPQMRTYLTTNGPWSQLVNLNNINIQELTADSAIQLAKDLHVIPLLVPHRGEFTETVGFRIEGPSHKALFIPDIDKWHLWERDIKEEIKQVDMAFVDATFFKNGEVGNRDMSEIPHPFVEESMQLFDDLPNTERRKIYFIHLNHTNPLLQPSSEAIQEVEGKGYHIAEEGQVFEL